MDLTVVCVGPGDPCPYDAASTPGIRRRSVRPSLPVTTRRGWAPAPTGPGGSGRCVHRVRMLRMSFDVAEVRGVPRAQYTTRPDVSLTPDFRQK